MPNKEELEKQHSAEMNKAAVERAKQEMLTPEEADHIEAVFFEDDEEIMLRDGKKYRIPPLSLKDARKLMKFLRTVNVDAIILNFFPSENPEQDQQREQDLYDLLLLALKNYPQLDRDYIDEYVDLETAKKLINVMIGLNGLKK